MLELSENKYKNCFIDSNIWLYSFIETPDKSLISKSIINSKDITISTQVINEVCVNLIKKALFSEDKIQNLIKAFYNRYNVVEINNHILIKASDIRKKHSFSFWDSLILASALFENCDVLYSEDMQSGFFIEGTKIINPFNM